MTLINGIINLDSLRTEIRDPVQRFGSWLTRDFGKSIKSFCIVGSAVTGDFHPKHSDINSLLVLDAVNIHVLRTLAAYGPDLGARKIHAPYLMTPEYLQRSHDVFGVEFLDFQLNHAMVIGSDPFLDLTFGKESVRLQCERELRSAQIQLWEGYIRGLGDRKSVEPMLTACVKQLLPVMRAMLWLTGQDRPKENSPTLEVAAKQFQFEHKLVETMLVLRKPDQSPDPKALDLVFTQVYNVVDHLCRVVDQMGGTQG